MSFRNKLSLKQSELLQEKFQIVEEKYKKMKEILKQVLQDLKSEREKNDALQKECSKLSLEVKEKEDLLERMQSVSEAVVDEFSTLKVKCDMETEAAANAIKRATMYFQENQKLKGNPQCDFQMTFENGDSNSSSENSLYESVPESELLILNKLNSDLRTEVASLITQLGKESERYESLMKDLDIVRNLYKQEMEERKCTEEKLKSLELLYNSLIHNHCSKVNSESSNKENNLENISIEVLEIINKNKLRLEQENLLAQDSPEKIDILINDSPNSKNSTEEDLKETLAETERQKNVLQNKVKELEKQILNIRLNGTPAESLYIPPPPPPPPPSFNPIKSFITFINAGKKPSRKASVPVKEGFENERQKVMSEMMNAIKSGNIQLKPVQKTIREKETSNTEPFALIEMKNILDTLKKRERPFPGSNTEEIKNDVPNNYDMETSKDTNSNDNLEHNQNNEMLHKSDSLLQETAFNSESDSLNESAECLNESLDESPEKGILSSSVRLSINANCSGNELKFLSSTSDGNIKVEEDSGLPPMRRV